MVQKARNEMDFFFLLALVPGLLTGLVQAILAIIGGFTGGGSAA